MHQYLDLDFRAIQAQLLGRNFVHSKDMLGRTEGIFRTREHGYRRVDDATFLHVMDFEVGRPYSLRLARPDLVCIQVTVSGTYSSQISDRVDVVKPATIHITNAPLSTSDTQAGSKLYGILIVCAREYIVDHFKLDVDRVPAPFRPIFGSSLGASSTLKLPARADVMTAADQIFFCKYQEPLRHIFLNAKATEILCGVVAQINSLVPGRPLQPSSTRSKRAAIEAAANIYRRELFNAPTIEQLATRVGLNRNEITKGFREAFGMTPHTYGQSVRMEQARLMLQNGDLSISEVARRIGYEGYSSFSRAYRSHFGKVPSVSFKP
jgi:AraC-like DNA-binding protein